MILAILGATAAFFGGAYIGTVVDNATESPKISIQQATVSENKPLSKTDFLLAGALGVGSYWIYKRYFKK
jgi:hypothetical protein